MRLRAAALLAAATGAHAGIGYSTLRLNPCSQAPAFLPYQVWSYNASTRSLDLADGFIFNRPRAPVDALGPAVAGASLWTSPGTGMTWTLATDGSVTPLAAAGSANGLCAALVADAQPGVGVWLQSCVPNAPEQSFKVVAPGGAIVHAASGLCLDAGSAVPPCQPGGAGAGLPFCNVSMPMDARVADLVARLTPLEKASMLDSTGGGSGRLGVAGYQWWQEALHTVANNVGVVFASPTPYATSFPMAITSSMAFNTTLWHAIGTAIGTEARAFANVGHTGGLTFWAPTINLGRDPRWGRIQETPGEDPLVTAQYTVNFVKGMQEGEDPRYLRVVATCKHFAAYSLESWNGTTRDYFDAQVTDADLVEYYLTPFQACIQEARAAGIMCSYNALNGVPTCANDFLLTQVLRNQWGADAYVTSDCGAVSDVRYTHQYTSNASATAAVTLRAGMDMGCDDFLVAAGVIPGAIADGSISQADVDTAVARQLRVRMRTGEFDTPRSSQPYNAIPPSAVCSAANLGLARDGARQGITLTYNPRGVLPLARAGLKSIAVVGPLANSTTVEGGPNYNGIPCDGVVSTVLSALAAGAGGAAVTYAPGCANVACNSSAGFAAATAAAAAADVTVVAVGIDQTLEDEGLDRVDIGLPGLQGQLVTAACAAAGAKPCVLVVISGGAVDVAPVLPAVSGAFYVGLPGAVGAQALVELLFGDAVPAGRLTQTHYPASFTSAVSLFEMGVRPGPSAWPPFSSPGRTHMCYTGPVVWPFGYGLSYTTFNVSAPAGPRRLSLAAAVESAYLTPAAASDGGHGAAYAPALSSPLVASYAVNVTNTGSRDADYVALGFLVPPGAGAGGVPLESLFGFARVHVPAGATVTAWLGLRAHSLTRVVPAADAPLHPLAPRVRRVGVPGEYVVRVGVKAPDQEWAEARLTVE